jgi:type I restriction enzyme S subunit
MREQQDPFLGTLPCGWSFDRLKDIVALRKEKATEASAEYDYLELEDIESGTGRILGRRNTLAVESSVTVFKEGDVLFGKLRPYLEKYYVADVDGRCTGEILAFKPQRIASRFLFYCIASPWFIERCNALAYGAKMPRVSWPTQLSQFAVPLPPLAEQHRIAAYLDASCAAIDAAIAAKRRQIETLDTTRESLIEHTVTRGVRVDAELRTIDNEWLTMIPIHWQACRIKRIVSSVDYGISQSTEPEGRYPVLKMGHIQRGEITFRNLDFVHTVPEHLLLDKGDLLFNRTNSPDQVGKAAIFRRSKADQVTFASYLVRLRTNHRADARYLNYLINCAGFLSFARKLAIPSVQQSNLNSTRYCRLLVPRPPLPEQIEIAAFLDKRTAELNRIVANVEAQIAALTTYRKSLIHECVTGQRRISEADLRAVTSRTARVDAEAQPEPTHA